MKPLHRPRVRSICILAALAWATGLASAWQVAPQTAETAGPLAGLSPILSYISSGWDTLTRSMTDCNTVVDPKLTAKSVLYLPAHFSVPASVREMERRCNLQVRELPLEITAPGQATAAIDPEGLLYLENNYVVPGGRFNEMYGWDSYFIVRGLLENNRVALARGMVDNFFFEIEHYGTVLNANRTYYLTRAQPPFLSSMVMAVYAADKAAGHEDRKWLERAYQFINRDYEMWNRDPHRAGDTGLSRYYDFGNGPAPESLKDESGVYRKVAEYFLLHPEARNYIVDMNVSGTGVSRMSGSQPEPIAGPRFSLQVCDAPLTMARPDCDAAKQISLTADYYKGDRAMRESGFDISFRFEPYGAATHHFAPVCLNSLLYKTEKDLQQASEILGRKQDAERWQARAQERKERIQKYLWDEQRGMFFDYNLDQSARSTYEYVTTFYPLWAGLATREQADAVRKHLAVFEHDGGLAMSNRETGVQWDLPYGWAPTQWLAIEGLRRYGFDDDANRVAYKFLATIAENFRRDGTIREKYNVITRSSESHVEAGYNQNVVGFGWTNGAFLALLHALPEDFQDRLAKEQSASRAPAN
ncbi:MAG: trehalase family glycosidase [Terriglobales bacterium]|jgi:alpha,alpha-trehalase